MSRASLCCSAAKRGNFKPSWMFAKSIATGMLRPHCPKCGAFEWPRTRRLCAGCQFDSIMRVLDDAEETLAQEGGSHE